MFRRTVTTVFLALVASLLLPSGTVAQNTQAEDFAGQQDLLSTPPVLSTELDSILDWAVKNGSFSHLGGPPFPPQLLPFMPAGVEDVIVECDSGRRQISAIPRCVRFYSTYLVELIFADGSTFLFKKRVEITICNNGTTSLDRGYSMTADAAPTGDPSSVQRSVGQEDQGATPTYEQRIRARLGATADFRNRGGVAVVSGGPLTLEIAPGGTLDLRQNSAAAGPIFVADGPMLVRCDTILLDPGVVLSDLCNHPPIVQPAQLIADVDVHLPSYRAHRSTQPGTANVAVFNTGHAAQQVQLTWSGAFVAPGQATVILAAGAHQNVPISIAMPPATPAGAADVVLVQWTSSSNLSGSAEMVVANDHPGQFRYGDGTPGNLGAHTVDANGPLAAGGPVVQIATAGSDPSALGLAMFGVPLGFQYGTWMLPGFPAELYIDPAGPLFITTVLVADSSGTATFPLQIANAPGLRGLKLDFQALFLFTSAQYPFALSSTPALSMTVQ